MKQAKTIIARPAGVVCVRLSVRPSVAEHHSGKSRGQLVKMLITLEPHVIF